MTTYYWRGGTGAWNTIWTNKFATTKTRIVSDGASVGTAVITSATAAWALTDVGTPITGGNIQAGSYILSRQSSTQVTLNKTVPTGSAQSWTMQSLALASISATTNADDVIFDEWSAFSPSTTTITPAATSVCRSLDMNGYSGTVGAVLNMLIGGTTDGAVTPWVRLSPLAVYAGTAYLSSASTSPNAVLDANGVTNWTWGLRLNTAGCYLKIPGNFSFGNATYGLYLGAFANLNVGYDSAGPVTTTILGSIAGTKTAWQLTTDIILTGATPNTGYITTAPTGSGKMRLRSTAASVAHVLSGINPWDYVIELADNQLVTFTAPATFKPNSIKFDMSVQANVKVARVAWGASFTTGTLQGTTFVVNAGQRLGWASGGFIVKAGNVTGFSNVTLIDSGTLTGGTGWTTGTNIGVYPGVTVTGITPSTSIPLFRVGNLGANYFIDGVNANGWAISSNGTPGTGRTPLPQDSVTVDQYSGTGSLLINSIIACLDLNINTGTSVLVGADYYTNILGGGTLSPAGINGNLKSAVAMSKTGVLGMYSNTPFAECPDGPVIMAMQASATLKLSASSKFMSFQPGVSTTNLDLNGYDLIIDPQSNVIAPYGVGISGSGLNGTITVGTGTLTFLSSGYFTNVGSGIGVIDATVGTVAFAYTCNLLTGTGVKFAAGSNLKILGGTAADVTVTIYSSSWNLAIGKLTLDRRAIANTQAIAVGSLIVTNPISTNHPKIKSPFAGTQVIVTFTIPPVCKYLDVNDIVAAGVIGTSNAGVLTNTTNWSLIYDSQWFAFMGQAS